jgi:CENP-B N-terminal DNA-binding domain
MSEKKVPKKRQAISLETKIVILDRLDAGEGSTSVAKSLSYNEATIRTIYKSKDKIIACVAAESSISAKNPVTLVM